MWQEKLHFIEWESEERNKNPTRNVVTQSWITEKQHDLQPPIHIQEKWK